MILKNGSPARVTGTCMNAPSEIGSRVVVENSLLINVMSNGAMEDSMEIAVTSRHTL